MRIADKDDDPARRSRDLLQRPLGRPDEPRPQQQVLGRVPGDGELGEEEQIDAKALRLLDPRDDPLAVPREVADDRVDLREAEPQFAPPSRKPSLPGVEIVIDPRFNGPPHSANGGYTCGLLAAQVGEPVEITLRAPPPLATALRFDGERLWDGETLVAEAAANGTALIPPPPVPFGDAVRASEQYPGLEEHAYPTCFVCGPARRDGLRLFTGPVRDDLLAAPWVPTEIGRELVWAALDCPGAIAVGWSGRGEWLLGRMAGHVEDVPRVGERCVVTAQPLGREGRKGYATTAAYGEDGRLLGVAHQVWIEPR
jgi:hypothetical protein